MPYQWSEDAETGVIRLHLRPNRALAPRGFALFIGATAAMMALPLLAVLGKAVLWVLLPFLLVVLGGIWIALRRNQADLGMSEELTLTPDRLHLVRHEADGRERRFEAQPYWLVVDLHPEGQKVEDYLTLRGDGRIVELGAFLAPEERRALAGELRARLAEVKRPAP